MEGRINGVSSTSGAKGIPPRPGGGLQGCPPAGPTPATAVMCSNGRGDRGETGRGRSRGRPAPWYEWGRRPQWPATEAGGRPA